MNKNVLFGTLVGGVVSFFLGWLVFGVLLMDFYTAHTVHYDGLMKQPEVYWAIVLFNLAWGWVFAYVLDLANARDWMKGAMTAGMLGAGIMAAFDLTFYAFYNLNSIKFLALDV